MSRFDYDTIFYRVFCATILGIAFTFTVILTNVFIDIDGLLSKKYDNSPHSLPNAIEDNKPIENIKNEIEYNEEQNYMYDTDSYRAKRSIEPNDFVFQVKNPNMKKILTNKLATLLEEMDEEETAKGAVVKLDEKETRRKEELDEAGSDNMLHLAMHNILLQGIIGHMDLNDVYKKVHLLIRNFYDTKNSENPQKNDKLGESKDIGTKHTSNPEEQKFFEELLKCKSLQNQLVEDTKNESQYTILKQKEPKLFIKTVIEINENRKIKKDNDSQNKDIIGLIKLIYNGKSIKFQKMDDDDTQLMKEKLPNEKYKTSRTIHMYSNNNEEIPASSTVRSIDDNFMSNPAFHKMIETYLKQYPIGNPSQKDVDRKATANRLKRQIKIHYVDKASTRKPKPAHDKIKKDDEELYIEIETHFDGKGSKGEKKKKLVRNLIDKIQKAINEDATSVHEKKPSFKHIKVKKRNQDPIKPKHDYFFSKIVPSLLHIDHREVDPIGKILPPVDNILDYRGNNWKRKNYGPAFLTASKSVNSAEMGELVIHYDSMLNDDIPKRVQKPITVEQDNFKTNNTNNVTFYLKDIDGSGFSVGFNQYVDEPPDADSLKLFNGLENLIKEYHKSYDTEDVNNMDKADNFVDGEQYPKREQENFSIAINNNYNNYLNLPKEIDRSLNRQKRSLSVKKISNIKTKVKLNKFLNTKTMMKKRLFLNNKRNKREVNKIRIIARERSSRPEKGTTDNLFLVPPENTDFSRKSAIKDTELPDTMVDESDMQNGDLLPLTDFLDMNYPNQPVSPLEDGRNLQQAVLMSKYPHIFFEEVPKSTEFYSEEKPQVQPYRIQARTRNNKQTKVESNAMESLPVLSNVRIPGVEDIVNAILPHSKSNFKVTVKISPKNFTNDLHSGFKEIHTSVNKSYDKNGVRYFSTLNVSQISKIENLNESTDVKHVTNTSRKFIPETVINNEAKERENQVKLLFELHKKRIDEQMDNLQRERMYLENLLDNKNALIQNPFLDITDNIYRQNNYVTEISDKTVPTTTSVTPTTSKTTTRPPLTTTRAKTTPKPVNDQEKEFLIATIKHHNNTTNEILRKINENTNLLRIFLNKLSNHLEYNEQTSEKPKEAMDWKNFTPNKQLFRKLSEFHNSTHNIPYIYTFSQPIETNPSINTFVFVLLLFEPQTIFSHAIAKPEISNDTDVFEVKPLPDNGLQLIDNNPKEPSLFEIIYYHIIRKPFGEVAPNNDTPKRLDFDQSVRPFTNGQGYQFVEWKPEEIHPVEAVQDVTKKPEDKDTDEKSDEDDKKTSLENDSVEKPASAEDGKKSDKDDGDKKDDKSDYNDEDQSAHDRRKREINDENIPSAPTLPDLNLNELPSDVRKIYENSPANEQDSDSTEKVNKPKSLPAEEKKNHERDSSSDENSDESSKKPNKESKSPQKGKSTTENNKGEADNSSSDENSAEANEQPTKNSKPYRKLNPADNKETKKKPKREKKADIKEKPRSEKKKDKTEKPESDSEPSKQTNAKSEAGKKKPVVPKEKPNRKKPREHKESKSATEKKPSKAKESKASKKEPSKSDEEKKTPKPKPKEYRNPATNSNKPYNKKHTPESSTETTTSNSSDDATLTTTDCGCEDTTPNSTPTEEQETTTVVNQTS
ncbi:putative leucine-rich repeat-containing protein DDB_G0290503 [Zerene cesonia]|uniref:putative leucine-rich repeat-containing protein DDB_G0290503 n=1 Tax=Zerene cesonia TaxID=33412 RepID=UPI0018E543E4|nr:putative leucine-rich repeat-containing protein DDB_G0290503 [Zerene cesonia]